MSVRDEYRHLILGSKWGTGVQGPCDYDRLDRIADRILALDGDLELYLPRFGPRCFLRVFHTAENWKDPRGYAEHAAIQIERAYRYGCRDGITGNEQIALEGIGQSEADYRWLNWWGMTHLEALRAELAKRGCYGVRLWVPALSPGHEEDDGIEGYRYLAGYLNAADGIAAHYYWTTTNGYIDDLDFHWYGGRLERAHALIEGQMGIVKPWIITEYNSDKVNVTDPVAVAKYVRRCQRYVEWLNSKPYVVAAFHFLHCSTDTRFYQLTWDRMAGALDELEKPWDRQSEGEWAQEATVTPDERDRYYTDLWKRWGAGFNLGNAIARYWAEAAAAGHWLGPPVEPEHQTENAQYVYQAFTGGVLHAEVGVWEVKEGMPPLLPLA